MGWTDSAPIDINDKNAMHFQVENSGHKTKMEKCQFPFLYQNDATFFLRLSITSESSFVVVKQAFFPSLSFDIFFLFISLKLC